MTLSFLIGECIKSNFPLQVLFLTVQQHVAPRLIQNNGFVSHPLTVSKSILVGCKQSLALSRGLLLRVLSLHFKAHPHAPPSTFVDDTAMITAGSAVECYQNILNSLVSVAYYVKVLRLTLSPKAALVTRNLEFSFKLVIQLRTLKIPFTAKKDARDLGLWP